MFDIEENIKLLPDKPGVYIHKDDLGHVIYVGKAISLKNRVRQYFRSQTNMPAKVKAMVSHIAEFEYITTDSEMEALILECNLIKKYRPEYNILLRDDKTYPYIKITLYEDYPRILKTRRVVDDGSKYFGPYSDVGAVNEIIDLLNSVYTLKRCSAKSFPADFKPCLNYHIEQCKGICNGNVSREEYMKSVEEVSDFLKGHSKKLVEALTEKMIKASETLDFEMAADYRDKIAAVNAVSEKQKVVLGSSSDMDMILTARGKSGSHVILFYVRNGKLSGRESFHVDSNGEDDRETVIASFMKQYYTKDMLIPKEIAVEYEPADLMLLEEWLSEMRKSKVRVFTPQKGEKHALLKMAQRDVIEMMKVLDDRATAREERRNAVNEEMNKVFGKMIQRKVDSKEQGECSWRIESYDISNTSGVDSVGGMVVFENGKPQRRDYRKFKIKTVDGPDDYSSMQEVIYRRFRRAQEKSPGFERRPDLIFVDGGLGHVNAVKEVLSAMNEEIPVAGMVKDDRHRTRGLIFNGSELNLKEMPVLFRYVTTIQDEVHRFAINYHKNLRNKSMQKSFLDEVPGIGEHRKHALLSKFGSVEAIKNAPIEELADTDGMNKRVAEDLKAFISSREAEKINLPEQNGGSNENKGN